MWKSVKLRLAFYREAILSEIKRSRRYQIMTAITSLSTILTFLGLFFLLHIPLPAWSWKGWLIAFLTSLIASLFLVMEAIYRFHSKTVSKIVADFEGKLKDQDRQAKRVHVLCEAIVIGKTLYAQLDQEQLISDVRLARWRAETTEAIAVHFGSDVAIEFCGNRADEPLSTESEQRLWLNVYVKKLGDLLTAQLDK